MWHNLPFPWSFSDGAVTAVIANPPLTLGTVSELQYRNETGPMGGIWAAIVRGLSWRFDRWA